MSIHQKGTLPVAAAIAVAALLVYGCGLASALDDASAAPPRAVPGGPESAPPEARAAVARFMRSESVFIQNAGQWADADIAYALDGQGANVGMTRDGVRFQLFRQVGGPDPGEPMAAPPEVERHEFRIAFGNAALTGPVGRDAAEQTYNFQIGDPSHHRSAVPSFKTVWYERLYPGIDLEVAGRRTGVKYNFHVGPGADWRQIRLRYEDVESIETAADGSLRIVPRAGWAALTDPAPYVYQERDGLRVTVAARFAVLDVRTCGFEITGAYDPALPLVIDPMVEWSTYLGGSDFDYANGVAVDGGKNVYVTGYSLSPGWASGGFDTTHNADYDGYVVKISSGGTHLWSTYLGGDNLDNAYKIAVNSSGNVYVAGETQSLGWTSGGGDTSYNGSIDGYVVKLSNAGAHVWSTYLGGGSSDYSLGLAIDAVGNIYVEGGTASPGWISGGFNTTYAGSGDSYVVKLNDAGEHLWSTYLGGSEHEHAGGVAVDGNSNVYVTGYCESPGWTSGGFDTSHNGAYDGYVVKLNDSGGHLWSTYLGGSQVDYGFGIALDSSGNVYVTGYSESTGWTSGGFDTTHNGSYDGYVVKLNDSGGHLWSTYLGGASDDYGISIASGDGGNVYVTGNSGSPGWTSGGFDTTHNGMYDGFVMKLSDAGGHLWSSYLGGGNNEYGLGIAVDDNLGVYVAGVSASAAWTSGGFDTSHNGGYDGFVMKITDLWPPAPSGQPGQAYVPMNAVVVNSYATSDSAGESLFTISANASGVGIVSWGTTENIGGLGSDWDGLTARTTNNGVGWSGYIPVLSNATSDSYADSQVRTVLADDGTAIAGLQIGGAGNPAYWSAASARSTNGGASYGGFGTREHSSAPSGYTHVAASGTGSWLLSWFEYRSDVVVSRSTDNGASFSSAITVFNGTTSTYAFPKIAGDAGGNWVAVWESDEPSLGLGGDVDLVYSRSSDNGQTWTAAAALLPWYASDSAADSGGSLACDGSTFVYAWNAPGALLGSGSDYDVACIRSTDGGATWAGPCLVNNYGTSDSGGEGGLAVTHDRKGNWFAVWSSSVDLLGAGADPDLFGAVSRDGGVTWSDVFLVNSFAATDSGTDGDPVASPGLPGTVQVAWQSYSGHLGTGVDGDIFSTTIATDPPIVTGIAPATTGPTNVDSVSFTVTFDEPVQNFDAQSDLIITHSGTAHSGVAISGGPSVYSVDVTGLTGDGSFTLSVDTASGVQDSDGYLLASSVASTAVMIDNTGPQFTAITGAPSLARLGQAVSITFTATEPLAMDPDVTINGNAAMFANLSGLDYTYMYTVLGTDPDGPAAVSVSGADPVGNTGSGANNAAFVIDNTPPGFTAITAVPSLARLGQAVSITFTASEPLAADPGVTVNGNAAMFANLSGLDYTYMYTVLGTDPDGFATIIVSGLDLAGNSGSNSSDTALEIDSTAPQFTAIIADPAEASEGMMVRITFGVSEPTDGDPVVAVNGHAAARVPGKSDLAYEYTVLGPNDDLIGPAAIEISCADLAGNFTAIADDGILTIVPAEPPVPLVALPAALVLAALGACMARRKGN